MDVDNNDKKTPKGWKKVKLGDVAEIVGGGTPKTNIKEYWNGEVPWITPRDLSGFEGKYIARGERNISKLGLNNSSAKLLPKGTVLLSTRAPVGYLAIAKNEISTNQGFRSLIPNEKIENEFLYYLLKNNVEYLKSQATGTTFGELAGSTIKSLEFFIPPLPEQKAIASVLSSLDDKIDLLHRQNQTLEKMAETLFRQWFVEEADEEWEIGTLNDVLTVKGGTTPSTKNPDYWDGDIHWTSPRDITTMNSIYLFDTERKITEAGLKKISSGLLPKGTLLMSSRAPVGVLAFAEIPIAINQGYIAILDNKGFSKEFLFLWLKTNMDYVQSYANGSTFLEISKSAFKSLEIQIPPEKLRNEFQEWVTPHFKKIKSNQTQIRTLNALRDTLLPKLMSGKLRVKRTDFEHIEKENKYEKN
jgi:type I restriction enzyme S subunit